MTRSIDLVELLDSHSAAQSDSMHTCLPAKVVKYNATTQTADVQPLVKRPGRNEDGEVTYSELPLYPNIQVAYPRAGKFTVYLPCAAGTYGHLIFLDMANGEARSTGQVSEPQDVQRHGGAYAIFYPGGVPDPEALYDAPSYMYVGIDDNDAQVEFEEGEIRVGKGATDYVALAPAVDDRLTALKNAFSSWTPVPNDGGAALKTLLTTLIGTGWPASTTATVAKAK
jgi:hypothetical protein